MILIPEVEDSTLIVHGVVARNLSSDSISESRFALTRSDRPKCRNVRVQNALTDSCVLFLIVTASSDMTPTTLSFGEGDIFDQCRRLAIRAKVNKTANDVATSDTEVDDGDVSERSGRSDVIRVGSLCAATGIASAVRATLGDSDRLNRKVAIDFGPCRTGISISSVRMKGKQNAGTALMSHSVLESSFGVENHDAGTIASLTSASSVVTDHVVAPAARAGRNCGVGNCTTANSVTSVVSNENLRAAACRRRRLIIADKATKTVALVLTNDFDFSECGGIALSRLEDTDSNSSAGSDVQQFGIDLGGGSARRAFVEGLTVSEIVDSCSSNALRRSATGIVADGPTDLFHLRDISRTVHQEPLGTPFVAAAALERSGAIIGGTCLSFEREEQAGTTISRAGAARSRHGQAGVRGVLLTSTLDNV